MAAKLTELGRRVLGSLPAWAEDEPAMIAANADPENAVRSHTLAELTPDLAANPALNAYRAERGEGPITEAEVQAALEALQGEAFAEHIDDATIHGIHHEDAWRMTQEGFEALTGPVEAEPDAPKGAVTVALHPAIAEIRSGNV